MWDKIQFNTNEWDHASRLPQGIYHVGIYPNQMGQTILRTVSMAQISAELKEPSITKGNKRLPGAVRKKYANHCKKKRC